MRSTGAGVLVLCIALGAAGARLAAGGSADPAEGERGTRASPAVPGAPAVASGEAPTLTLAHDVATELETAAVERAASSPAVTATGRVLDPTPFVQSFVERRTARRGAEIASRELRRVSALHREADDASEREVEAARLAEERARADRTRAEARFIDVWGPEVGARGDLPALVEDLARHARAVARIELPAGAAIPEAPRLLSLSAPTLGRFELASERLGAAPSTDAALQGPALLLLLGPGAPAPGTALLAEIASGRAASGVQVPDSALVWHDGHALVFVAHAGDTFETRPVVLGGALAAGWQVTKGLALGERVVTRGAQQLLSARTLPARTDD